MTILPTTAPVPAGRVASVDALRGLTILLMVFVNDLGPAAPSWMHRYPATGCGWNDTELIWYSGHGSCSLSAFRSRWP